MCLWPFKRVNRACPFKPRFVLFPRHKPQLDGRAPRVAVARVTSAPQVCDLWLLPMSHPCPPGGRKCRLRLGFADTAPAALAPALVMSGPTQAPGREAPGRGPGYSLPTSAWVLAAGAGTAALCGESRTPPLRC